MKMGADAVSVHINVGSETESDQLQSLGCASETLLRNGACRLSP